MEKGCVSSRHSLSVLAFSISTEGWQGRGGGGGVMVNFAERRKEVKRTLNFRGTSPSKRWKNEFSHWLADSLGILILFASHFFHASITFWWICTNEELLTCLMFSFRACKIAVNIQRSPSSWLSLRSDLKLLRMWEVYNNLSVFHGHKPRHSTEHKRAWQKKNTNLNNISQGLDFWLGNFQDILVFFCFCLGLYFLFFKYEPLNFILMLSTILTS